MSVVVYKYELEAGDNEIELPRAAQALHVGVQGLGIFLWASQDPDDQNKVTRKFHLTGTGVKMETYTGVLRVYVGSVIAKGFAFHLFEVMERRKAALV